MGFWRDSNELNEEQRLSLLLTQSVDFERCFARASAVGPTLIVARDAHDGAMVGIASIERAVADVERQTLHMRYDAEARLRAWHRRQKSDGDDDDDTEPSSPSPSSSAEDGSGVAPPPMMMPLDADEDARYLPVPIIANVAVAPSRRRSGIATALLRECFEEVRPPSPPLSRDTSGQQPLLFRARTYCAACDLLFRRLATGASTAH